MILTGPLFASHGVLSQFSQDTSHINPRPIGPGFISGMERLSTEPIGAFTVSLSNIVIGSICEIEIISPKIQVAYQIATSSDVVFQNIPVYQAGDSKNVLRIKVRKASSPGPYYQPYETQTIAFTGNSSIFVNQVRDDE